MLASCVIYLVIDLNITIMGNFLQATGRLIWLPLCEYKGNGRVVSLTQASKEMQVVLYAITFESTTDVQRKGK